MMIVTGGFTATPDTLAPLTAAAIEHSRRSRAEDGCLTHHVHADCENPLRLFFYEEWRDLDALRVHFGVPESGAFVRQLREAAASVEEIAIREARDVPVRG